MNVSIRGAETGLGRSKMASAHEPLRVLHIIASVAPASGGPIEGILRQNEACGGVGGAVQRHIVTLDPPTAPHLDGFPIPVTALGSRFACGPLAHYRYTPALVPWLKANLSRFDVALVHGLWNYAPFGAARVLPGASFPYFVFVHGMLDPWFRRAHPLKHAAKHLFWALGEGRLLAKAKAVFFTSQEEMRLAAGAFPGHPYRGEVVGYGVVDPPPAAADQTDAFRAAVPALGNRPFLLFLGRIHPKKGCDLLIEAFARVAAAAPDLVIAGPDHAAWQPALAALAARHGVGGRVHWAGPLYGPTKWGALRAAEAFVLPSHQENFGIAVAEALACGTPVLISDKVNIWRDVADAGAGFVEPDTVEGTATLLRRWLELARDERSAVRRSARALFERRFDVTRTAPELVERMRQAL